MVELLDNKTYKQIAEILADKYGEKLFKDKGLGIEDIISEYQRIYEEKGQALTPKEAYSEFVADCMTRMLSDTNAIETVTKLRSVMDKPTQNKFIGKIRSAIAEIRNYLRNVSEKDTKEAIWGITAQLDCLQNIADLWAKGVTNSMNEFERLTKSEKNGQKNNTDTKDSVKYSLKKYNEHQIENWKNSKRIVIYNNNEQLTQFIQDSVDGKNVDKKMYFGAIPSNLAKIIQAETGLNVENYNLSLGSFEIRKILKDHGDENKEFQRGQRAVTVDDFAHIVDIVLNPTKIALSEDTYMGKPVITFKGKYNGKMNVVAVVSDKRLDLFVQTVYVNVKKRNLSTPIDEQASINTPEANNGTVSNNSISNSTENVNNKIFGNEKSQEKFSVKTSSVDSEGNKLTEAQQEFYKNSVIRDAEGRIKPFYHGTARADRVGNYFNPERATSGPMAYFTDNQKIAENYSRDKADTSLAYDSEYDSYETQFRVNVGGKSVSIVDYWKILPIAEKNRITQRAEQLTIDDDYENLILKPGNKYGNGGFDLRYARGNALQALVDCWLGAGYFIGEEESFLDVLQKVGIENAEYKNPDYREEKVYKVYLNITNPLYTKDIDNDFIADLEDYVENTDMSIYENESSSADMWDKNSVDIYDWIERLRADVENGTTHAWTSIPDVVTDFLKNYGNYDGIVDQGGKNGGEIHTVAIPFYSNQIKNVDNLNPTDSNDDIRYSAKTTRDEFRTNAMIWAYSADTKVGDTKILFGGGKGFALLEATENGYIELAKGDYKELKEVKEFYESHRTGEIFNRGVEGLGDARGRSDWSISNSKDSSNEGQISRLANSKSDSNREGIDEQNRRDSEKFSIKTIPNNRVLLANALETVTQNDIERKYIRDYKAQIGMLEEQQEKLKRINEEIGVLSFAPGKRDTARLKELTEERIKTQNRINIYDKKLLRLEATKPLQNVINSEVSKLKNKLAAERQNEIESRYKTGKRHQIRQNWDYLSSLIISPKKQRNIGIKYQQAVKNLLL